MNYDFYADRSDAERVLEFLFMDTDICLLDLYSDYGQEIGKYSSLQEALFRLGTKAEHPYCHFQIWSPRHCGVPTIERVSLDPRKCGGHTFRYTTLGWGMIQLYFNFPNKRGLSPSHLGHCEERGAYSRAGSEGHCDVAQWNWKEVRRTSRKLQYHIQKKLAVTNVSDQDTRDILPGALEQFDNGVTRLHV